MFLVFLNKETNVEYFLIFFNNMQKYSFLQFKHEKAMVLLYLILVRTSFMW